MTLIIKPHRMSSSLDVSWKACYAHSVRPAPQYVHRGVVHPGRKKRDHTRSASMCQLLLAVSDIRGAVAAHSVITSTEERACIGIICAPTGRVYVRATDRLRILTGVVLLQCSYIMPCCVMLYVAGLISDKRRGSTTDYRSGFVSS